jgi:uncharacterized Fe-S cluster-containing protein
MSVGQKGLKKQKIFRIRKKFWGELIAYFALILQESHRKQKINSRHTDT